MNTWYAINRKPDAPTEAEISIYDAIGAYGISAEKFVADLKAIKAKTINVRLNTPGGEVFDGTAIYNALREHPARIVMHVDGVAASAGSFVATAGDEVRMADNAYLMIHNAMGGVMGGAEEMRSAAAMLEKINGNIAGMYQRKAGRDLPYWRSLMDAETWMTADEAKASGLVDTVYASAKPKAGATASADRPAFDFKVYNKIPDPVRQLWGLMPSPPTATVLPPKEPSMAADNPPVAAAPAPAAAAVPATPQPPPPITSEPMPTGRLEDIVANFRQVQGAAYEEKGRKDGIAQEKAAESERVKAIVTIAAGKPQLALNAILAGQSPESFKLAFDMALGVETQAKEEAWRKDQEILRLHNILAAGGHPGVAMSVDPGIPDEPGNVEDPKSHAELEWDHKPSVRRGFANKENYVAWRVRDLQGTVQLARAAREE